ncbi:hypothetical protein GOODEAATRI_004719, partial [Goodea atripinnis]
ILLFEDFSRGVHKRGHHCVFYTAESIKSDAVVRYQSLAVQQTLMSSCCFFKASSWSLVSP